jgi:hypothetical protein
LHLYEKGYWVKNTSGSTCISKYSSSYKFKLILIISVGWSHFWKKRQWPHIVYNFITIYTGILSIIVKLG